MQTQKDVVWSRQASGKEEQWQHFRKMKQRLQRKRAVGCPAAGKIVLVDTSQHIFISHPKISCRDFFFLLCKLNGSCDALWKSTLYLSRTYLFCETKWLIAHPSSFVLEINIWTYIQDFLGNWLKCWNCFSNLWMTLNYLFIRREGQGGMANKVAFSFVPWLPLFGRPSQSSLQEPGPAPCLSGGRTTLVQKMAWSAQRATHCIGSWKCFC